MFATLKKIQLTQFRNFKDLAIMRNLSQTTFITLAAMITDNVEIVTFANGDWFANFTFTDRNKRFQYVDTRLFNGVSNRKRFEKSVTKNGLTITYDTIQQPTPKINVY